MPARCRAISVDLRILVKNASAIQTFHEDARRSAPNSSLGCGPGYVASNTCSLAPQLCNGVPLMGQWALYGSCSLRSAEPPGHALLPAGQRYSWRCRQSRVCRAPSTSRLSQAWPPDRDLRILPAAAPISVRRCSVPAPAFPSGINAIVIVVFTVPCCPHDAVNQTIEYRPSAKIALDRRDLLLRSPIRQMRLSSCSAELNAQRANWPSANCCHRSPLPLAEQLHRLQLDGCASCRTVILAEVDS